jgi:Tfp pilus assembly protein PilN
VIAPNLAGRPFLNTRPVWLVTGVAGLLALVLISLNIGLYFRSNRTLEPQIEYRSRLIAEERALAAEVGGLVETLDGVPWKSLGARVNATNQILREQSFSWLILLDDIARVMPYDVRVFKIAPDVGPASVTLNLMVVARTRDDMLEFLENLVNDPRFSQPTPRQEEGPEKADVAGYLLTLTVLYKPLEVSS